MIPDLKRMQRVAELELRRFEQMLGSEGPLDHRGAQFIQWLATFIPESLDEGFQAALTDLVERVRRAPAYATRGWYELFPLEAALFALTGERQWLSNVMSNWDNESSAIRRHVHVTISLIADRLPFHDADMQQRTRNALSRKLFFNDYPLLILAVSRGTKADKIASFQEWWEQVEMQEDDTDRMNIIREDRALPNTLLAYICSMQSYALLRLGTKSGRVAEEEEAEALPGPAYLQSELNFPEAARELKTEFFESLLARMDNHPLMQSLVRLREMHPEEIATAEA